MQRLINFLNCLRLIFRVKHNHMTRNKIFKHRLFYINIDLATFEPKVDKAVFSVFWNILQPSLAILLIQRCSFKGSLSTTMQCAPKPACRTF
jgi:hypothetical protein